MTATATATGVIDCAHEWLAVTAPNGDRGFQCRLCRLTRITLPPGATTVPRLDA